MATVRGILKICRKGHRFYKSSDCPVCPVCEDQRKPDHVFLSSIAAPARRALERSGIKTLAQLSKWSQAEILALHGIGPASIPKLQKALELHGFRFRKE